MTGPREIHDVDRSIAGLRIEIARLEEQARAHSENADQHIKSLISELEIKLLNRLLGWVIALMTAAGAGITAWLWGKLP